MVYLVNRNLEEIVNLVLENIGKFISTTSTKLEGLKNLLHIVVIAKEKILDFAEEIFKILYKILFQFDEPHFQEIVNITGLID